MAVKILDGKSVSRRMMENLKERLDNLKKHRIYPKLVTLIPVPDDSTLSYVRSQRRSAEKLGIILEEIPVDETELFERLEKLNEDEKVHGIMVTQPLPKGITPADLLMRIDPKKDVEGVSPASLGRLVIGEPMFIPCTAEAAVRILVENGYDLNGKHSVVIGRSTTVGKPLALMLLLKKYNSTVTVCHTGTKDLSLHIKQADYVFVAVGKAGFLRREMVSRRNVIVDIGINFVDGKLVGDADFEGLKDFVEAITPVPGGVGSVTTAILMEHLVRSAERLLEEGKT